MNRGRARHLVRRALTSVRGRAPSEQDDAWARAQLTPAEAALYAKMSDTDRAHAVEVARQVVSVGGEAGEPWVVAAALLHDIGKIDASLGTVGRVVATVVSPLLSARAVAWLAARPGPVGALGRHVRYPETGASLLGAVGSDPRVRAWAAEHHRRRDEWTVPVDAGAALRAADDAAS